TIGYGNPGDLPFMGDWDCDGVDTPGLYRQSDGFVYLRDSNTTGVADISFFFGNPGDIPLVGDFDGDGCDTVSVYRPSQARFFIINDLGQDGGGLGAADYSYIFGNPGDVPFVGDWNGDDVDTAGLRRPSDGFVYLRNNNNTGIAHVSYFYGNPGDIPFAGDWDGNGVVTVGLYRPANRTFYLRNSNSTGIAHVSFVMGETNSLPVAGDFDLSLPPPPPPLQLQTVISGLDRPVFVAAPAGDDRLFVVEQTGDIEIVEDGVKRPTPFLDLTVTFDSEKGLLGLAFHPDYDTNGRFYVNYTIGSLTRISEFVVSGDPNLADSGSERVLIELTQPFTNHNGGMLLFDAQGYLLIALGDGGGAGDPGNRAQDPNNLLGKILRIDVDQTSPGKEYAIPVGNPFRDGGGAPEVYVLGVRNPWRIALDMGALYVADVGQDVREEVTVIGSGIPGSNLGWRVWEGTRCYSGPCFVAGYKFPQVEYSHPTGCSVTGGLVYRGSAIPGLAGTYFYGDFCGGWVNSFRYENSVVGPVTSRTDLGNVPLLSSFGYDGAGELYVTSLQGGVVRKIVTAP
ncbi:MAG: PQQ-dependent sugar dehydrogenase, partial [Actinobacteria bacterium]|nr:PQQ-dependent sugar dehydrogenase [Actinomycetota bacterium]